MSKFSIILNGLMLIVTSLFLGLTPIAGLAQNDDTPKSVTLDEVTVVARRKDENLQSVPVAVQAFSGEYLERANITGLEDIANRTSGMVLSASTPLDQEIFIRGIGTDIQGAAVDNPVGIFVDGVFMSRNTGAALPIFDLEQVEVLKGPQSLRFGKNVVGGLVQYVTKKPTDEFEGEASVTAGNYHQIDVTALVRGPMTDTVNYSLAAGSLNHDGYATNTLGGESEELSRSAVRGQLEISPSDDLSILLAADVNRTRGGGRWVDIAVPGDSYAVTYNRFFAPPIPGLPGFVLPDRNAPFQNSDPRKGPRNVNGENNSDIWGTAATINWDINDAWSLLSITAYRHNELLARDDGCGIFWNYPMIPQENGLQLPDASSGIADGTVYTYLDDVPDCWFDQLKTDDVNTFSQEIRMTWDSGGRTSFAGGVYFLDEDIERTENVAFSFPDFNVITDWAFAGAYGGTPSGEVETEGVSLATTKSKARNLGIFAEGNFDLTDQLSLNAGIRFAKDDKDFSVLRSGDSFDEAICQPDDDGQLPEDCVVQGEFETAESQSWTEWLPAISLAYTPSDATTLYARYERGYKPGGYTGEGAGQPSTALVSFDPEYANAYELGAKILLADRRVRLNTAIYLTDYKDLQTQQFLAADPTRPPDNFVVNAKDGTQAYGAEVDFEAAVTESFMVFANYAYTKCEFKGELIIDNQGTDIDGNTCRRTPENAFNVGADYKTPVTDNLLLSFGGDYQWRSTYFFNNENTEEEKVGSEFTLNMYVGVSAQNSRWSVKLWAKNLTDELNTANVLELFGTVYYNYAAPRTYGVTYRRNF